VHVNSTREGGGVAEILNWLIPFKNELGLEAEWEVVSGDRDFYQCTKSFHNGLQGNPVLIPPALLKAYEKANQDNAERMRTKLEEADFRLHSTTRSGAVAAAVPRPPGQVGVALPYRFEPPVSGGVEYLRNFVVGYDASIWSLADFAQPLPHPLYLIAPSIDPLSQKNIALYPDEVHGVFARYAMNPELPLITQVSRFDRFKDRWG